MTIVRNTKKNYSFSKLYLLYYQNKNKRRNFFSCKIIQIKNLFLMKISTKFKTYQMF